MKRYTFQELIQTSQYFFTKPDRYVIQKSIKKALVRMRQQTIKVVLISILVGAIIGVILFQLWLAYREQIATLLSFFSLQ